MKKPMSRLLVLPFAPASTFPRASIERVILAASRTRNSRLVGAAGFQCIADRSLDSGAVFFVNGSEKNRRGRARKTCLERNSEGAR